MRHGLLGSMVKSLGYRPYPFVIIWGLTLPVWSWYLPSTMRPITVSISQLRDILAGVTHAEPFSATTLTKADAKKTLNPYGTIRKLTKINGMVGTVYANAINRQRERENVADSDNPFIPEKRSWGVRVAPGLVEHKGEYFLPAQLNPSLTPKPLYLIEKPNTTNPSKPPRLVAVDKSVVAPFLPPSRSIEAAAAQGVTREVVYRDFRLDSIVNLSLHGRKYRVRQPS